MPSPPAWVTWASRPRSSTWAPGTGRSAFSTTVTFTEPAACRRSTTGSLVAVSFEVIGPPTPVAARATSVYERPTSLSNAKLPSASVVAVRDGLVDTTTVAPATGASLASSTRPSSRSAPDGSSSIKICCSRSSPRSRRSGPPEPEPAPGTRGGAAATLGLVDWLRLLESRSAKNQIAAAASTTAARTTATRGFIGAHYDRGHRVVVSRRVRRATRHDSSIRSRRRP